MAHGLFADAERSLGICGGFATDLAAELVADVDLVVALAVLARQYRLVAALGDGGFLMAGSEVETAAWLGLGRLVVVYDDAAYGAEVHHVVDADHATVTFPDRELGQVGRASGATGWWCGRSRTSAGCRRGSTARGTARSWWTPRWWPTGRPDGWPKPSGGTNRT